MFNNLLFLKTFYLAASYLNMEKILSQKILMADRQKICFNLNVQ